jgi:hypothetical protein
MNINGKHKRNLDLLGRWVAAEPYNIVCNYKLGCALLAAGRQEESLFYLEKALKHFPVIFEGHSFPFMHVFAINYHKALVSAGKTEKARIFEQMIVRSSGNVLPSIRLTDPPDIYS